MKDVIDNETFIISASKVDDNFLIDTLITQFDKDYNVVKNIKSNKIDINNFNWKIYNAEIFENQSKYKLKILEKNLIMIINVSKLYFLIFRHFQSMNYLFLKKIIIYLITQPLK